jgi:hypothetical protein
VKSPSRLHGADYVNVNSNTKIAEVRVNKLAANSLGVLLTIGFCIAGVFIARALPHYRAFAEWHAIPLVVALIILLPIHEAIHALGLVIFARVAWCNIRFGIMWHALMPYCHCTALISVAAYRRMALLPLWITGAASLVALLVFPTDVLGFFSGVTVGACVGDLWMVARLRRFEDHLLVQDSPTDIGCDVLSSIKETVT